MAKKIDLNGLEFYKGKENAMIADEYSSSSTYAVGDYAYHAGTLYKCTTAITTAEAWTSGHWTAAKLAEDVTSQSEKIDSNTEASNNILAGFQPIGDLVPNKYITPTGAESTSNVWSATDYLNTYGAKEIIINCSSKNNGNYDAFYDSNKQFISNFAIDAGITTVTVPNNAVYVRLSNSTTAMQSLTINWWLANDAIEGGKAAFKYIPTESECDHGFIDINGEVPNNSAVWYATPYVCVPFPKGGKITVKSTIYGNGGIAFYDRNKNCIYAITGNNASSYEITPSYYTVERELDVPKNTFYVRACVYISYSPLSSVFIKGYGLNEMLFALGNINQSILELNEDIIPTVNASANYGYHSGGYSNTKTRFCLLVTTDPHGQKGQLERAVEYLNQMPCFTCGVTLGDIQATDFADNDGTWYTDVIKTAKKNWLTIIGNHDAGHNNDPAKVGTPETVYQKFIAPNMQYAGATDTGKSYYYKDVDTYKVRLICLNDYDYTNNEIVAGVYVVPRYTEYFSSNQISWLISTLSSTPSDYTVLIMLHNCPARATKNTDIKFNNSVAGWYYESTQNGIISDIVDAWQNGSTLSQTYTCTNANLPSVTVSADFTSRGDGLFAGFLCGHAHADNVGTVTAYPTQNVFTFSATAKGYYQNSDDDLPRQDGTKAADCITALSIDTVNKKVMITRIGSDVSNTLEKREPSVIAYT